MLSHVPGDHQGSNCGSSSLSTSHSPSDSSRFSISNSMPYLHHSRDRLYLLYQSSLRASRVEVISSSMLADNRDNMVPEYSRDVEANVDSSETRDSRFGCS